MEEKRKGGFPAEGRKLRPRRSQASESYENRDDSQPRYGERHSTQRHSGTRQYGPKKYGAEKSHERSFGQRRSEGRNDGSEGRGRREGRPYRAYDGERNFGERNFGERRGGSRSLRHRSFKNDDRGIEKMLSRKPRISETEYSDNDSIKTPIQEEVRLNKFIANSGVCSRREADQYILAGAVTVNGEVVTELGSKVNVLKDEVRLGGERLHGEEKVYLLMNKPKGYVTTTGDPHAEKTVMDLIKSCTTRVFPVGRLDKNTTGVLMLTNDGDIAEKLTHPSYDKKKIYQVILDRPLSQEDRDSILAGIELSDGAIKADELEYIDSEDHRKLGIEIHSGKNRIVRRIFESLGYDVRALDRVYFAGFTKKGLKKGEWRYLTEGEVNILKIGAYV